MRGEGGEEDGVADAAEAEAPAAVAVAGTGSSDGAPPEVESSSGGALNLCAVAAREPYSIRTGVEGTPRGSVAVPDDVAVAEDPCRERVDAGAGAPVPLPDG